MYFARRGEAFGCGLVSGNSLASETGNLICVISSGGDVLERKKGHLEVELTRPEVGRRQRRPGLGCGWDVLVLAVPLKMIGDSSSNGPTLS